MIDRVPHAEFPSDETLAAFIDGGLDPATRRRVGEHLTTCADCYDAWTTVHEMRVTAGPAIARNRRLPMALAAAAIAIAIAGILFFATTLGDRFSIRPQSGLSALADAAPPHRNIHGRLSGFPYRPLKDPKRSVEKPRADPENWKLYGVAAHVAETATTNATHENLHAFGVSYLMLGEWDEAIEKLEEALHKHTGESVTAKAIGKETDVSLLNDLSAAYFARGQAANRAQDLFASAEASERAFVREPSPDTAFNRALAIEAAHGPDQAIRAWNEYLALDSDSPWADEARQHLARSESRHSESGSGAAALQQCYEKRCDADVASLIGNRYFEATTLTIERVLPDWAEAKQRGDAKAADRSLRFAKKIGDVFAADLGEMFIADAVAAIERDSSGSLARAHLAYRAARVSYRHADMRKALQQYAAAGEAFRAGKSPVEILAASYHATSAGSLGDLQACLREIRAAVALYDREGSQYFGARGQLRWAHGVVTGKLGLMQEAIDAFRHGVSHYTRARQRENTAAMHSMMAQMFDFDGDAAQAWQERRLALELSYSGGQMDRLVGNIQELADAAEQNGWLYSAARYRDETVAIALQLDDPVSVTSMLSDRARGRVDLGQREAAAKDLAATRGWLARIADPIMRTRVGSSVSQSAASFASRFAPHDEEAHLTAAITRFQGDGFRWWLSDLYLRRAKARLRSHRDAEALVDLRAGIHELETLRTGLPDRAARARYFARSQGLFDLAIEQAWNGGRIEEAFALAEQSRARALLDASALTATLSLRQVQQSLPVGARLVEYAIVPGRLLIWVVSRERVDTAERTFSLGVLESIHNAKSDSDYLSLSARLYETLIGAVDSAIGAATQIVIVPNKELAALSFSSLYDGRTRRFLIERAEVIIAPSATLYVACLGRDRQLKSAPARAFIVGQASAEDNAMLPAVESETRVVARLYPRHDLYFNRSLEKAQFLDLSNGASVIHFAGHAVPNDEYPEFASLVIAPNSKLYAHEIAARKMSRTRIVVLSSCGQRKKTIANEVAFGVPNAFLAAGVAAVVAATDPVDDASAANLAVTFHEALGRSGSSAAAFRDAQRQLIRKGTSPRQWGVWQLIGGSSL